MTQDPVITDEMRKIVGVESEPSIYEIEKEPIRRWAEAIGDPNPLYRDEEYARRSKYGGVIVPPGFLGNYAYPVKTGKPAPRVKLPFSRALAGGNEYEFFKPVRAGEVITATTRLADIYERQGRPGIGRMLFLVNEVTHRSQQGEIVARTRHTSIYYEGPGQ